MSVGGIPAYMTGDRGQDGPHGKDDSMGDLIFWIVIFVIFFFGFRWLQQRRSGKDD